MPREVDIYPEQLTSLLTQKGFVEYWINVQPLHRTHKEAYEYCEAIHCHYYRFRKYSSYESFRNIRRKLKQTIE